jgi:hypothetical protein
VAIYTGAKALSRWPINDESTLTRDYSSTARVLILALLTVFHIVVVVQVIGDIKGLALSNKRK